MKTRIIVIEKYFFGWCYHRYTYTETIEDDKPDCPESPVKKKKQKRKHPKNKKAKTKEIIRQAALPNEERRKAFSVEFQKGREYNKKVKRISTPDIDEKEGE